MSNIKKSPNVKQQFFHYELWEDYQSGMYNLPCIYSINSGVTSEERIYKAIECLSNEAICRKFMKKVVNEWKIATQQVLTNPHINKRLWLAQCACFMYGGCLYEETNKAWRIIQTQIKKEFNKIADNLIDEWLVEYSKRQVFLYE